MIFTLRRLRVFLLGLLFIIGLAFLWLKVVPSGRITYQRSWPDFFRSGQGFIQSLTPAERVDLSGPQPRLVGDPVYFSVFTPRTFNQAKLTIVYRDRLSINTPVLEAGVLVDKLVWRYNLVPLQNKILDQLAPPDWTPITEAGLTLWQAASNYEDLSSFQADLKSGQLKSCLTGLGSCLAVYNYPQDNAVQQTSGQREAYSDSSPFIMAQPLRGPHQFYLKLSSSELRLDLKLVDLNQDKAADPVSVNLYRNNQLVDSQELADSNLAPTSGRTEEKAMSFSAKDLAPGVYKAEIKTSQDIVIKEISNSASQPSFIHRLWPVSAPGPLTLFTDARYLQVKAFNPASLGEINFAGQEFLVAAAYDQFNFYTSSSVAIQQIDLRHDDLILENNGVFSFSKSALFNPALKQIDQYLLASSSLKYILAAYQPPLVQGDLKVATAEFNLQGAYREKGSYSFIISIPGLRPGEEPGTYLEIKSIKLELSGRTLVQKIFNKDYDKK